MLDLKIITKKCINCNKIKELTEFNRDKSRKDGFDPRCRSCRKLDYAKNQDKILAQKAGYRANNKEKIKKINNAQYDKNKEKRLTYQNLYYQNNKKEIRDKQAIYNLTNKEQISLNKKSWVNINRDKVNFYCANRRSAKLQATPSWLTKEDLNQIHNFYKDAAELTKKTSIKHHVDHIVPLMAVNENNERVACGLHVPWNLRIVPRSINCRDGAKLIDKDIVENIKGNQAYE